MGKHSRRKAPRRRRTRRKRESQFTAWWKRLKRRVKRQLKRNRIAAISALLIIAACVVSIGHHKLIGKHRITVFSTEYNGIDVSKHQGVINWERVAKDPRIQFVYIKATEGASLVDKNYHRNFDNARKNGLLVGSYHFFTSYKTPEDQFKNFKRQVKKNKQDLIPMVDVEEAGNRNAKRDMLQHRLWEFMNLVKEEYGVYPILYSQYTFYNTLLAPEFNKCIIFIARYSNTTPDLKGWGKYNIWQYTEKGRVDGIKEYVDLDRFENGTKLSDILL